MAQIVSNIGNPSASNGNTITAAVYVFATPNIEIIESENPRKLEPVSPINVLAGAKLNGRNPTNDPANAVINRIEISGDSLSTNIINKETADITEIPADNPSNPSIKLMALVTPTIHPIVKRIEKASFNSSVGKKAGVISSILIPNDTATIAANTCPANFTIGFIVIMSSMTQKMDITTIPKNIPH